MRVRVNLAASVMKALRVSPEDERTDEKEIFPL